MASSYCNLELTSNLVVGLFFARTNVNNTKQGLVHSELLRKCSEVMRVTQLSDLL
jgi:hypothetical protein